MKSSGLRGFFRLGPSSLRQAGLRRIAFIVFAQRIGLTREEIAVELARLPLQDAPSREDWSSLSGTWASRIDERITELEWLKLGLSQCIGCGCLSIDRCRLANPRDRAARLGPGPRYWVGDCPPGQEDPQVPAALPAAETPAGSAAS